MEVVKRTIFHWQETSNFHVGEHINQYGLLVNDSQPGAWLTQYNDIRKRYGQLDLFKGEERGLLIPTEAKFRFPRVNKKYNEPEGNNWQYQYPLFTTKALTYATYYTKNRAPLST